MTREQAVIEMMVALADTTAEDFDIVDFVHRITRQSIELLDCTEAGVLLADATGDLRVMGSSNERSDALDLLQSQHQEGPCFECYHRSRRVFSADLAADQGRWPTFAPAAIHKGFGSVQAVPMRARGGTIGALNLFRVNTGPLIATDLPVAQGIADIAAVALIQQQAVRTSSEIADQLQRALSSRVVIEQAKGLLSERAQINMDLAFERLRAYARGQNRRLHTVARELIDGQLDADALTSGTNR